MVEATDSTGAGAAAGGDLKSAFRQPLDSIADIAIMCRNGIAVLDEKNGDCSFMWRWGESNPRPKSKTCNMLRS